MRNACAIVVAAIIGFVIIAVAAFRFMEWWQALLTLLLMVVVGAFSIKYIIKSAVHSFGERALRMTEGTSKILRGASVDVHSVKPTEMPNNLVPEEDEFASNEELEYMREERAELESQLWYKIELTVFPHPEIETEGVGWNPEELAFVKSDASPPETIMDLSDEDVYPVHKVKVLGDDVEPDDEGNYKGPQRLLILAGFPHDVREVSLRYIQEQFGTIKLPAPGYKGLR